MDLARIELTYFLKKIHFNSIKVRRIMSIVKLCDMKLTRVKENCE